VAVTAASVLNGLRLRRRLSGLATLDDGSGGADDGDFTVLRQAPVFVDGATRRAAALFADKEGLDVIDLVPGDLPSSAVADLGRRVDTTAYRTAPFAPGRGALHAVLVRSEVWDRVRSGLDGEGPGAPGVVADRAAFVGVMETLKHHAPRSCDLAVAPRLAAIEPSVEDRLGQLRAEYDTLVWLALVGSAARSVVVAAGVVLIPGWGAAAAAAAYGLESRLAQGTAGSGEGGSDSPGAVLWGALRRWAEPFLLIRAALSGSSAPSLSRDGPPPIADPVESRRPVYAELLAGGIDGFFEGRRSTCPLCGGADLAEWMRCHDWLQFKPGQFVLDRCRDCGHVFQNPRLSSAGLDFYYRDAYDGLGARNLEYAFAHSVDFYRARVDMVRRHLTPESWLDVGTGYGHFCLSARGALPDTRFDGLDMGESIEESARRGWVDHGYRGMFPVLADELAGRYDIVSMHHYLEHTVDPWAELDAASRMLSAGAHLLIELPNPESPFGRLLGPAWVPWLQPQHLHFFSVGNLQTALEARGFTIVDVERGPAHQPVDLSGAALLLASALAPPPCLPWRNPPTVFTHARRVAVFAAAAPFAALGMVADRTLQPLVRTRAQDWSSAFRVLARRNADHSS
jgi:SAM-dependent methyltransferase